MVYRPKIRLINDDGTLLIYFKTFSLFFKNQLFVVAANRILQARWPSWSRGQVEDQVGAEPPPRGFEGIRQSVGGRLTAGCLSPISATSIRIWSGFKK